MCGVVLEQLEGCVGSMREGCARAGCGLANVPSPPVFLILGSDSTLPHRQSLI